MGASSSGLLDEAKIANIKGLVINMFQSFSVFYHEQHAAAFLEHLHQEVEPRKEGRGLLLAQRPQDPSDTVLYQGGVHLSGCDEQVKKWKERYAVLRKDHNIEIHENQEAFSRGCAAKLVLQTAGGVVFSTEEESRAHLEQTCAGVLNDVKDDSSSVVSPRDVFGAYLHLPYVAPTCFLFKQEEERDHFLSALKTCIRHSNLEPWCDPTYESQAFIRALQLYRQEKGCYESWEMLLGTEEKVLSCQLMEEVLPCLQRELHSKVKGKKMERIRQWTATMQATYTLVLEQVSSSLQALRDECCQKASSSQTLIRSDLDQIVSSLRFLEGKVRACVCEEAEGVCAECVAPYISSVLEALAEKISAGFSEMQQTLRTQMDAVFAHKSGGTEETKKALSGLRSTSLERCYRHVEKLTEKLEGLKQRFGLKSTQRLVHSAQLDMEKLLDNAVYTLELFLQPSAKLQPLCAPVKMAKAKERVLKQLDYDSRVLQRRLYQQALLEITLPTLFMKMGSKWKTELRTLEQYIFSDYSSFILIRNVHNEVLRNILSNVIETVLQDAACKKINNVLVDTSDLAISQYSLLGQTPPPSAPDSPDTRSRDSCPAVEDQTESEEAVEQPHVHDAKQEASASENPQLDPASLSPLIVVTQELNGSASKEENTSEETTEEVHPDTDVPSTTAESDARQEDIDPPADREGPGPSPAPPHITAECFQGEEPQEPPSPDLFGSEHLTEKQTSDQHLSADSPVNIRLGLLSQAIAAPPGFPAELRSPTDRAVYLSGEMKDNWEVERVEEEEETRRAEVQGTSEEEAKETGGGEEKTGESAEGEETPESPSEPVDKISQDSEPPEGSGATSASRRHAGEEEEQKEEEEEEQKEEEEEQKEEEEEEQKEEEEEQKEGKEEQKKEEEEEQKKEEEEQKEGEEEQKEEEEEEQKKKEEEQKKEEKEEKQEEQEEEEEEQKNKEEEEQKKEEKEEKQEEQKEEAKKEKEEEQQEEEEKEEQKEEEEKEEQKEEEKQEEQKEEEKEEAKKEKEEEQQKEEQKEEEEKEEEEEEQEVDRGRGGGEREEVLHDGPPLEPGPDSIAAIRELVSEVIEVEVNIGPDPDLPQGHPAPPTSVSL